MKITNYKFIVLSSITFIIVATSSYIYPQEHNENDNIIIASENILESETLSSIESQFTKELDDLSKSLDSGYYSQSLYILDDLKDKITLVQKKYLNTFFPSSFETFEAQNIDIEDSLFDSEEYGILFNKRYKNSTNEKIDINLIHSDPSIQEYVSILNNPRLIQGLVNTQFKKVQNYQSLYSKTENNENSVVTVHEQNIVLNQELMITFIYIGEEKEDILTNFIDLIDLKEIEKYLNK